MPATAYATIAQVRFRELKTRVGLAAFIGVAAHMMAPTIWPSLWFTAVVISQIVDLLVFRPLRRDPEMTITRAYRILCCASAAFTVIVYSAIAAYLWSFGGEAGRLFAMVQVAGGLLHVSLHMHQSRSLLLSAVIPHSLYFLGMPTLTMVQDRSVSSLLIAFGGVLYMAHLVVAVRQSKQTTRALTEAKAQANAQRNKAEVASAAKSDFLAVISHEIRTPMNAVISAANLLRRTRMTEEQREHVAMLVDAGDVLVGLLNDVLDFSKIEAGKMALEQAEMPLREKLSSLIRLWEPKALAQGVDLTLIMDESVPAMVRTDPLRLQQILFNLISNAVKFTRDGEIFVTVDHSQVTGRLEVAVRDTGCGIAPDRLVTVFDSFEQADAGTTRRYGGTGLGLAISRRLAEMMGGELTVQSRQGEGSTFLLSVPIEALDKAAPIHADAVVVEGSLQGRVILAADDHPVNRRILSLLLEPHGCRLVLVENGQEAVEAARVTVFDAVLMDMQMPVLDGLDATRAIRAAGLNRATPVIALTANAMDNHRATWQAEGVHAFLTKPIDPALLATTLAQACAGRDAVDTAVA